MTEAAGLLNTPESLLKIRNQGAACEKITHRHAKNIDSNRRKLLEITAMHHLSVRTLLYGGLALSIAASLLTLGRLHTPRRPPTALHTRLEAYWQARVAHDMPRALQYEHPKQRQQLGEKISRARLRSGIKVTGLLRA